MSELLDEGYEEIPAANSEMEGNMNSKGWLGHLANFLGVVVVIIVAVVWLKDSLHVIDTRLLSLENSVKDRWTRTDMKLWAQDFQIQNDHAEIVIPRVPPSQFYRVNK